MITLGYYPFLFAGTTWCIYTKNGPRNAQPTILFISYHLLKLIAVFLVYRFLF